MYCLAGVKFLYLAAKMKICKKNYKNYPKKNKKIYQNIPPSDENNDFESNVDDPFVAKGSLVLTNDEYPSRVYVGEVFPITIYARTTENIN